MQNDHQIRWNIKITSYSVNQKTVNTLLYFAYVNFDRKPSNDSLNCREYKQMDRDEAAGFFMNNSSTFSSTSFFKV